MKPENIQITRLINNTYVVVETIGYGGFGEVWKAVDLSFKNFVAIKKLFKEYSENINFISMFYKEASIAKELIHDNIVRVYRFWTDEQGGYYILMDYVYGKNLEYIIKKCKEKDIKIPWVVVCYIGLTLSKVLDFLHKTAKNPITGEPYNLVYMDLSPGNVMISFDGKIKITDFGVTRAKKSLESSKKFIAGKYNYMSPEQIVGGEVDFRTDIFSLGIILYELLTFENYQNRSLEEIKEIIVNAKFDFEKLRKLEIPISLYEIIEKMLKKNKEERYSSAFEVYRDLRAIFKEKYEYEIEENFVSFVDNILKSEKELEGKKNEFILSSIDINEITNNPAIEKINCVDFIPGSTVIPVSLQREEQKQPKKEEIQEEKGKTIFEEVGSWLIQQIKIYKKRIIRVSISFFISLFLFFIIDTFIVPKHLTPIGKKIYSYINPPDLILTVTPPKGSVTVVSRKTQKEIFSGYYYQPIELRKLLPGTYEILLKEEGYIPVKRVVTIDEEAKGKKQRIELMFTVNLAIYSDPSGATIYLNGAKIGTTPWIGEVLAEKTAIQLEYPNFEVLGSAGKEEKEGKCILDLTQTSQQKVFKDVDSNYWIAQSSTLAYRGFTYILVGKLPRKININSYPENTLVFLNDSNETKGSTPLTLLLPKGTYKITLKPTPEYETKQTEISVTETSQTEYYFELRRYVTISAYDKITNQPIKVNYKILGTEISGITPAKVLLYPKTYKILFYDTQGRYLNNEFLINVKTDNFVKANLQLRNPKVLFEVVDEKTKNPISDVFIWIDNEIKGKTDAQGKLQIEISTGTKQLRAVATKYETFRSSFSANFAEDKHIFITLKLSNIKCPNCGEEYPGDTLYEFCIKCGTKLPK